MNKQTKSNLRISLQSLGIIFLMSFAMAFACKDGSKDNSPNPSGRSETDSGRKNTDSGGLTEEIVKRKITESAQKLVGGTGPKSVDVEFESIKIGKSETPSKQDEIDGIRSDVYYPVRVKYTIIKHWASSDEEKEFYEDWNFFIDSYGEWSSRYGPAR